MMAPCYCFYFFADDDAYADVAFMILFFSPADDAAATYAAADAMPPMFDFSRCRHAIIFRRCRRFFSADTLPLVTPSLPLRRRQNHIMASYRHSHLRHVTLAFHAMPQQP